MMNKLQLNESLKQFGLNDKQIQIYLSALKSGQITLLELSRLSGVNRTTAYRLVEELEKLGLIEEIVDQHRIKIQASSPEKLEQLLVSKQAEMSKLQQSLPELVANLSTIKDQPSSSTKVVYFRGQSGLKQLLWNILKTKGESVGYGYADWNQSVGIEFAERLRQERVKRKIYDREIQNEDQLGPMKDWTQIEGYDKFYQCRFLPRSVIDIKHDTYIYNDVFAFFNFYQGEMFGIEIHNAEIAKTQKQIFEVLWKMAKKG